MPMWSLFLAWWRRAGAGGPLATVVRAEETGDAPALAAAVTELSGRLRDFAERHRAQHELGAWAEAHVEPRLRVHRQTCEACLSAWHEILADAPGLADSLDAMSARLATHPWLRLSGWLVHKIRWSAGDLLEREVHRHERFASDAAALPSVPAESALSARLVAASLVRRFRADPVMEGILAGLLRGDSVVEIAARVGISRPEVYRRLEVMRRWLERDAP